MQVLISAFSPIYTLDQNIARHETMLRHIKATQTSKAETVQQVVGDSRSLDSSKTLAVLVSDIGLDQAIVFNRIADNYDQDSWYIVDTASTMKVKVKTGSRTLLGTLSQSNRRTALYSEFHIKRADGSFYSFEKTPA